MCSCIINQPIDGVMKCYRQVEVGFISMLSEI